MSNKTGDFIWYELLCDDADAAARFYRDVIGWQVADSGNSSLDYRILSMPDIDTGEPNGVGGLLQLDDAMRAGGARPLWLGYIHVEDVDASLGALKKAGATVQMPASDIPGVGRIAMVADPHGAPFYIMRPIPPADQPPNQPDQTSLAFAWDKPRPGHCAWNELATPDQNAAWRFYGGHFGWEKESEMDMGPMGSYQFVRHGGVIGAFTPCSSDPEQKGWSYYFRVPDIDSAMQRITGAGGTVNHGPHEIPGGDFIVHGSDPQGAAFALVGARGTA
jgi:predicted enzyme related to lactoylglutathione lyase